MENSSRLWPALGVGTAVATIPTAYLILRFAPSPVEVAVLTLGVLLVALATFGYLATKRGSAAVFVAIALVLPYLLLATMALAGLERASSEIGEIFGGDDEPSLFEEGDESGFEEESLDEEGTYGSDPELDALQDDCLAGDAQACDDLYSESPEGSEYEATAVENGGGS